MTRYEAQGFHAELRNHRRAIELLDEGPFVRSTTQLQEAILVDSMSQKLCSKWSDVGNVVVAVDMCTIKVVRWTNVFGTGRLKMSDVDGGVVVDINQVTGWWWRGGLSQQRCNCRVQYTGSMYRGCMGEDCLSASQTRDGNWRETRNEACDGG